MGIKFQSVGLSVLFYKEANKVIAYAPALNLSTCGNSIEQAKKRFEEATKLFFEEIDKMNTLEEVLLECGWKKIGYPKKHWQPPIVISEINKEIRIPCPA